MISSPKSKTFVRSLQLACLGIAACTGTVPHDSTTDGAATGDAAVHDAAVHDAAAGDAAAGDAALQHDASNSDIPPGTVLFEETFDDADFSSRGWYDAPTGDISTTEHAPGSASSFECTFNSGTTSCSGGAPRRRKFAETTAVYLSFYIKHSANWIGSGHAYHPHLLHFVTNEDGDWVGPAYSHLTTYIESPEGRPFLGLQDSRNVDSSCILRNNDTFVGCNGDFDTYVFTENRSACSCNGLVGEVDGRDCFDAGSYWYSARTWRADDIYFRDQAGAYDKTDWHLIEAYFELNSIANGIGIPDGKIRYVYDGEVLISSDNILMRTGTYPGMMFDQFLVLPYIGDGSPVTQTIWIDDLTVATGRP